LINPDNQKRIMQK